MGSISLTPPEGPYISEFIRPDILHIETESAQSTYLTALSTYNNTLSAYQSVENALKNILTTWNITSRLDWPPGNPVLQEYRNLEQQLMTLRTLLEEQTERLILTATEYVDALTREQLYANSYTESTISIQISRVLNSLPADQQISELNPFPWLSPEQRAALQQTQYDIESSYQTSATAQLLTAFTLARHQEYRIALSQKEEAVRSHEYKEVFFRSFDPGILLQQGLVQECLDALNQQIAQTNKLINGTQTEQGRVQLQAALEQARNRYEQVYLGSTAPLISVIDAFNSYSQNYTATLANIRQEILSALELAQLNFQQADSSSLETQQALSLETFKKSITPLLTTIGDQATQLLRSTSVQGASTPSLQTTSGQLSLRQLVDIVSKVQLLTLSLIQMLQSSSSQINAIRSQLSIGNLTILSENIASYQQAAADLKKVDMAYNENINGANKILYAQFMSTYAPWYDLLQNHIGLVNTIIDDINTQIIRENDNVSLLVAACNTMTPEIVDAINKERLSTITSLIPVAGALPTFPSLPGLMPITPLSTFPHLTGQELPNISPDTPSTPDLSSLPHELPTADPLYPNFALHVDYVNDAVRTFLQDIAPYQDYLIQRLQAAGITITDPPVMLLLKSTIENRDLQLQADPILSPFISLLSFTLDSSISLSSTDMSAEEIARFRTILRKILQPAVSQTQTLGTASGLSIATAGLGATQSEFSKIMFALVTSEMYQNILRSSLEQIGILAGLSTVGAQSKGIQVQTRYGIPLSELEQTTQDQSLEKAAKQSLLFNIFLQLGLVAGNIVALQTNAKSIVQSYSQTGTLSSEELEKIYAALITTQQNFFLSTAMMTGMLAGLSPGQVIAALFPHGSISGITAQSLEAMGFTSKDATKLFTFALDNNQMLTMLQESGMKQEDLQNIIISLAISKGVISPNSSQRGALDLQEKLRSGLSSAGISITGPINSAEFLSQLETQLSAKIAEKDRATLHEFLYGISSKKTPEETLASFIQSLTSALSSITPSGEMTIPGTNLPAILAPYKTILSKLSKEQQDSILQSVSGFIADATALSNEDKAAIAIAVRLGDITVEQAMNMIFSYQASVAENALEQATSEAKKNIFRVTDEQRKQIEEDLRQYQQQIGTKTIDTEIYDQLQTSKTQFIQSIANVLHEGVQNENATIKSLLVFGESVKRLHDFNTVFLNYITNLGWSIIKQFSIYTVSDADKKKNPPIAFFG